MSIPLARHVSLVFLVTSTIVTAGLSACGTGGSGGGFGDDASGSSGGTPDSGSSTSSGSTSSTSSGGAHPDSGGSSSSGGSGRVPSNVQFDDAGTPICGTPCDLRSHICCIDQFGAGTCIATSATCPTITIAGITVPEATFKCVEKSDCPGNQVCCGVADSVAGTAGAQCEDVSSTGGKCTPATTTTQGSAQLCTTNGECKTGQCIWQDCMVAAGLAPSLTMCGIQSAAPFNCKAH